MQKMKKTEIRNVTCPFCGAIIKGKIPEGLNLKKVVALINKIKMAEEKNPYDPTKEEDWEEDDDEDFEQPNLD